MERVNGHLALVELKPLTLEEVINFLGLVKVVNYLVNIP